MERLNDKGQITVMLALLFMVMFMALLCFMDGIRCYLGQGLVAEAMSAAGKDVTANYHRALQKQYHLFFLDPKESDYIISDGRRSLENNLGSFAYTCTDLNLLNRRLAIEDRGKAIKNQCILYMKCKKTKEAKDSLLKLLGYCQDTEEKKEDMRSKVEHAEVDGQSQEEAPDLELEEQDENPRDPQEEVRWREIKTMLGSIIKSGILLYVCDDRSISNLQVDTKGLPSSTETESGNLCFSDPADISLEELDDIENLLQNDDFGLDGLGSLAEEYLLLEYWKQSFRSWENTEWKNETALHYEKEYMISGKKTDHDNLNAVANRIFLMRFATNYAYVCSDPELSSQAELMGLTLGGFLGLPQAAEAVKYLVLGALCYGETLLDLHALFQGHKVPMIKNKSTWMTNFENVISLLRAKVIVKEGSHSLAYQEYLDIFISTKLLKNNLCMKMADIMQLNISLQEAGFQMKDCVCAFDWQAGFHCAFWSRGWSSRGTDLLVKKTVSYE